MTTYLPYLTAATAALAGLGLVLVAHTYWRRRRRLRLRLVTGQRSLLTDQIVDRTGELATLEGGQLPAARATAGDSLDSLHAALLERQAHLQNYEDLAALQSQKIAVLSHRLQSSDAGAASPAPDTAEAQATPAERRERVQAELLERIQALQRGKEQPGAEGT